MTEEVLEKAEEFMDSLKEACECVALVENTRCDTAQTLEFLRAAGGPEVICEASATD